MRFEITDWSNKKASMDMQAGKVLVNFDFTLKDLRQLRKKVDEAIAGIEEDAKKGTQHEPKTN